MINLPKGLFDFQEACSLYLIDTVGKRDSKQTITVKAPTGAGKTVILIDFIDKYLNMVNPNTAFIWLCPGKGDLEEQSRKKMINLLPSKTTKNLFDALLSGFEAGSTTFINWELVTKKGNKAITDGEKKNLYERISEGHRKNVQYIIIIDEEHSNDTKKANDIINAFVAKNIIRVSATAKKNPLYEYYEVNEMDVISSGLITKALYINEDVDYDGDFDSEHGYLIEIADKKRKKIAATYSAQDGKTKNIRPLCIIQFPNSSDKLIQAVEVKLAEMGYTYENKMVAKWMSDEKINIENITDISASSVFLLMKQAIATGWDCPRAKILVKLRERMNEDFEIQTIGRLRRMPEATHYDIDVLDFCYLYTFDEKYKESIKESMSSAFETKRLFLKDKCKTFTLEKQLRNKDLGGMGERETFHAVYKYFIDTYGLTNNKADNKLRLEGAGYCFDDKIIGTQLEGKFIKTESIVSADSTYYKTTQRIVNTHTNGIDLLHSVDSIKSTVGMTTQKTKVVLERLFRAKVSSNKKIVALDTVHYYAFVINNEHKLKEDFRGATAKMGQQLSLGEPKTAIFRIPEQELYRFDPTETDVEEILSNAYKDYSSTMVVEGIRSKCERLFENFCETRNDIEWVYKNGDTGQQYFSIVYLDGLQKQWLFYPDYIVKKKNGEVWIIETKGGEIGNRSKNIDIQVGNKFEAFKQYAMKKNLKWGFVRDKNEKLKINNTVYSDSMSTDDWKSLKDIF